MAPSGATTTTSAHRPRWLALVLTTMLAAAMLVPVASGAQAQQAPGGPVILMGLDSEWGAGSDDHGPPEEHQAMVQSLLDAVNNGNDGILVIGDESSSAVEGYWKDDIADPLGQDVTFVSGVEDIEDASFDGYAIIGVASSDVEISNGLTPDENEALISRDVDIAEFVNDGGGLLGKTQAGMEDPFGYAGPLGDFEQEENGYRSIEVTQAGLDLGLTQDGMDGWCCYHEVITEYPDFMEALILHADETEPVEFQGEAAAVGGLEVTIPTGIDLEPLDADLETGQQHELIAAVEEDDEPAADIEVTFEVTDGPHEGTTGTATTTDDGEATFSYEGQEAGTDTAEATFVDSLDRTRTSNAVTVTWTEPEVAECPDWPDVPEDNEHYDHICALTDDGILWGFADGTFGPATPITRGQVASVIARTMGLDGISPEEHTYSDIEGSTHAADIEALAAEGVVEGFEDGTFRPGDAIRRDQVASIVGRWLDVDPIMDGRFVDVPDENVHAGNVNALDELGVIEGKSDTHYEPGSDTRRDQFAAFVNRAR